MMFKCYNCGLVGTHDYFCAECMKSEDVQKRAQTREEYLDMREIRRDYNPQCKLCVMNYGRMRKKF